MTAMPFLFNFFCMALEGPMNSKLKGLGVGWPLWDDPDADFLVGEDGSRLGLGGLA